MRQFSFRYSVGQQNTMQSIEEKINERTRLGFLQRFQTLKRWSEKRRTDQLCHKVINQLFEGYCSDYKIVRKLVNHCVIWLDSEGTSDKLKHLIECYAGGSFSLDLQQEDWESLECNQLPMDYAIGKADFKLARVLVKYGLEGDFRNHKFYHREYQSQAVRRSITNFV